MILKTINKDGYRIINLFKNNKSKIYRVHRLVAETFIPNISNKPFINHKNGNRADNVITNLEWCTQKENVEHAYNIGLNPHKRKILQYDFEGNLINNWESIAKASKALNISDEHICSCCKGKRKKAGGYKWQYA